MQVDREIAILDRIFDPLERCLTDESARRLVDLRADPSVESRVGELAAGANEGSLTPEERLEYEAYISASNTVAILQAKARRILANHSAA